MKTFLCTLLLSALPALGSYSAVNDFPTVTNSSLPVSANGAWAYGYSLALTPFQFVPDTTATSTAFGPGSVGFYTPSSGTAGNYNLPGVFKNTTGGPANFGTVQGWPSNLLLLHPGANDEYSVIRFTAPSAATYVVNGQFSGLDVVGTTTDVHALGGAGAFSLFSGNVNGYGASSQVPFSFSTTLAQGETIDFAVGYGSNNLYYDSTGFDATITATPEPGFYGLLALGMGGLGLAVVRRRRQAV